MHGFVPLNAAQATIRADTVLTVSGLLFIAVRVVLFLRLFPLLSPTHRFKSSTPYIAFFVFLPITDL